MPMFRWLPVCVGGLALLLGGCALEPEPPPATPAVSAPESLAVDMTLSLPAPPVNPFAEPARRALRIELGLDDYQTVDSAWEAGDASSTFTAYFDGDTLRFIEERLSAGEYGEEMSVYYFDDGTLFYAVQDAVRVRLGVADAARRDTVQLRVALAPMGDVIAAEGTVNGEPEPIDRVLIEGVRRHAEALVAQLGATASPPA